MSKIDTLTSIIMQLVVQFVKNPKQTNYQSNNENGSTYNTIETPLNAGVLFVSLHRKQEPCQISVGFERKHKL